VGGLPEEGFVRIDSSSVVGYLSERIFQLHVMRECQRSRSYGRTSRGSGRTVDENAPIGCQRRNRFFDSVPELFAVVLWPIDERDRMESDILLSRTRGLVSERDDGRHTTGFESRIIGCIRSITHKQIIGDCIHE
jgi:hypothetical protein